MIAADQIKFSGGGAVAWLVAPDFASSLVYEQIDRPCGPCNGKGCVETEVPDGNGDLPCAACHGSGRHCFDIETEAPFRSPYEEDPPRTFTVSVVPDMVLPVVELTENDECSEEPHVCVSRGMMGGETFDQWTYYDGDVQEYEIDPPAATKPGDWLVLLDIQMRER